MTDSAAQTLVQQINQGFSSTVNSKILSATQGIADKVEKKADETNKSAIEDIRGIQDDINKVISSLDDAQSAIAGFRTAAEGADSALAATAEQLPQIQSLLDQGSVQLDDLRAKTSALESDLSATILKSASTVSTLSADACATLKKSSEDLKVIKERLEALIEASGDDPDLQSAVEAIRFMTSLIDGVVTAVDQRVEEINAKVQSITGDVSTATSRISNEVMPQLNSGSYNLAVSFSGLSGAIGQFEPQVQQLRTVLTETSSALETATHSIDDAKSLLATIGTNLRSTVVDLGAIGSALEVDQLSKLLDVDPENVGTFISSPVHMVTEKINPVSNYGTAVAPFYTNLALWVGCFILVSLLKVEVNSTGFEGSTSRQRYFGRWMLFVILALLQSQVICGVDILLGIDCQNPVLFMLSGAVCSFAYMNLIFALVKTFRNIGKTLCIFLLIMQVPGSSGMYPIQMMPGFFQAIHPMLPFTYGIDAMREALCGMYGFAYVIDLLIILLIVPGSLLIGLALRPAMANLLALFDEEMNKVGFFASEENTEQPDEKLRGIVRAIASHGSYRDDIEQRAWRFKRAYPRRRKSGTIAVFAIPFVFLVLMLLLNAFFGIDTDVKLTILIIMLAILFIVQIALIVLEYMNRTIVAETRLIGDDLLADIDLSEFGLDGGEGAGAGAGAGADAAGADDSPFVPALAKLQSDQGGDAKQRRGVTRDIFTTDMRLGFQSAIGAVVIVLLVITPSLYAWFNIASSWDPYGGTGNLQVAVVNDDEGYKGELVPVTINIGNTVVSQLHANDSFNWVFVDNKEEAVSGVESSKYYAAIEIPPNFSTNMMTYIIDDAEYPDVIYYTNEKENPIAPIITQKGADAIQEKIRVSFTERVDEVALSVAYDVLSYVTNPKMGTYVSKMSRHLDDAMRDTKNAAKELRSLAGLVNTVSSIVETTGTTLDGVQAAGGSAKLAINDAKGGVSSAKAAFDQATSIVKDMIGGRELDIGGIQAFIDAAFVLLEDGSTIVPERIDSAIQNVKELRKAHPEVPKDKFNAVIKSLKKAKADAEAVPGKIGDARQNTDQMINEATAELAEAKTYFNNDVEPAIQELSSTLGSITSSTETVVSGIEEVLGGMGDSTSGLSGQLGALSGGLMKAGDKLEQSATKLEDTKSRVAKALKSGDVKKIESVILGNDPEVLAASLAAPIATQREAMYPVSNYGSAMASFYTVLSLWVGALVMISTMRVHLVEERLEELRKRYVKVKPRHEFFGRYGIFGFISLLQSALVLLGDLLFLHIQCENPILFLVMGIFVGQLFTLIVYTITELFGDVGKALCVILLIMQVAASGGTFPIEMFDPILVDVAGFLPFFYAMRILQECVAGILLPSMLVDIAALLVMAIAILIIGLPLRRPFRIVNDWLEAQLEKTGYM